MSCISINLLKNYFINEVIKFPLQIKYVYDISTHIFKDYVMSFLESLHNVHSKITIMGEIEVENEKKNSWHDYARNRGEIINHLELEELYFRHDGRF